MWPPVRVPYPLLQCERSLHHRAEDGNAVATDILGGCHQRLPNGFIRRTTMAALLLQDEFEFFDTENGAPNFDRCVLYAEH